MRRRQVEQRRLSHLEFKNRSTDKSRFRHPNQRPQRSTIDEKKMLLWDDIINCNAVFDMFEHHKIQLCACIVCFEGMHGRVGKDSTAHFCQLDKKYMGGVFIKPRIFEAQEPLQPVEQGYEKAQWYAN